MKKNLIMLLLIVFSISIFGCNNSSKVYDTNNKIYKVGIGQFAEHGSLDNCRKGFITGLKEEGFVEGQNIEFKYDNAQTDMSIANQIYNNYISNKMDLVVAIATPMAQTAYSIAKDSNIPVIYTAITDPIAAELANDDGTPVGNVTGTSDALPVEQQLKLIKRMYPDAKKLGILYTNSEVNSISSINKYKYYATDFDIEIVSVGINDTSDMSLACDNILNRVDVITNITDNTVVASLPLLLDKANSKNIPVFGSEIEQVKLGCIACMGLDYVELGKQTGKMAAKILKNETQANKLNYELIENASLYINSEQAKLLKYELDNDLLKEAKEVFNTIG